jgi:hypothetical protein
MRVKGVQNVLFNGMVHGRYKYINAGRPLRCGTPFRLPTRAIKISPIATKNYLKYGKLNANILTY